MRVLVTPELEAGKTYAYKIEAKIEPNNYTTIVRVREVTFKAGEEVTVDLRKEDKKIAPDNVIIRWVPTPKLVVKDMCELAKVTKDDVVMDPGCGDAIMIITAVQDFKAKRAIGTDYDPKKVVESQENVEKAGLKDKISVKEANALKLTADDLKDVTVVMLYMGNELNIRPGRSCGRTWNRVPGSSPTGSSWVTGSRTARSPSPARASTWTWRTSSFTSDGDGQGEDRDYPKVDPAKLNQ